MKEQDVVHTTSWLDKIKDALRFDMLKEKFNISQQTIIEIALYLGVGFLFGFLIKRSIHFIFLLILCVVLLVAAHQLEFITIAVNWEKIHTTFGISPINTHTDLVGTYWEWIKLNLTIVISFIIGLLIGLRIG